MRHACATLLLRPRRSCTDGQEPMGRWAVSLLTVPPLAFLFVAILIISALRVHAVRFHAETLEAESKELEVMR